MTPEQNKIKSNTGPHALEPNDTNHFNDETQGKKKLVPLNQNALSKNVINKGLCRSGILRSSCTFPEPKHSLNVTPTLKFVPNIHSSVSQHLKQNATSVSSNSSHIDVARSLHERLAFQQKFKPNIKSEDGFQPSTGTRYPTGFKMVERQNLSTSPVSLTVMNTIPVEKPCIKKNKSLKLNELSWNQHESNFMVYSPLALPFSELPERRKQTDLKTPSFGSHTEDDDGSSTVSVFRQLNNEEGNEGYKRNFLFLQFPALLPNLDKYATSSQKDDNAKNDSSKETAKTSHCAYRFEDLPEGFLGTLCFHQSGRVQLVIGNHQFDVNQGSECHFFQEVAWLMPDKKEIIFLGSCSQRVVVTPNLQRFSDP